MAVVSPCLVSYITLLLTEDKCISPSSREPSSCNRRLCTDTHKWSMDREQVTETWSVWLSWILRVSGHYTRAQRKMTTPRDSWWVQPISGVGPMEQSPVPADNSCDCTYKVWIWPRQTTPQFKAGTMSGNPSLGEELFTTTDGSWEGRFSPLQ